MIDYHIFCQLKALEKEGLTPLQIAGETGLDPRTVYYWLAQEKFHTRKASPRASKLDQFKSDIFRMLQAHPYSATQVYQRLQELGFKGRYTIVKDYVRKIRPPKASAFLRLTFAPGECAQVDWGSYGVVRVGDTSRRLSFFVMVLCSSRMMYAEFTVSQTMEHFLACHHHAFEAWGGVPGKIMVDNLKSAVLKRIVGQAPVFNPKYVDFADHYGFTIVPCNVGKGNEKGRVENGVGYIKKNFLAGLDIPEFSALAPAIKQWLDTVANVRIHGETKKKPLELFEEEKPLLRPLPPHPYDIANISQVRASSQFRVTLDTNRYSVPAEYAGRNLTLKAYPDRLCIYSDEKLVARHHRSYDRHRDFEHPDHPRELLAQRKKARDQKILARFLTLSPKAQEYYRELENRRMNVLHHLRQIVALSEIYPPEEVARALEDAFEFQAFSCEYIANILEQRSRKRPQLGALHLTRREDLLELTVQQPDLSIYTPETEKETTDEK
jgi:transposase